MANGGRSMVFDEKRRLYCGIGINIACENILKTNYIVALISNEGHIIIIYFISGYTGRN